MKAQRNGILLGVVAASAILTACIPIFTDGLFQSLSLSFRLDRALAEGEERLVHTVAFSEDVKVKKTFVQLSGRLTAAEGDSVPAQVTVTAVIEDLASGKLVQRITLRLNLDDEGNFKGNSRVRKNVSAGEVMSVTVEPSGGDLGAGSELTLCVDLVKKKGALGLLPACIAAEEPPAPDPGDPQATFSSLSNDYFAPTCSRDGCHSPGSARAGLVLAPAQAHANLVGVPSSQRPELNRVSPGDPDNSYLVKKLRGDGDIQGERMPLGGPFLSAEEIDRFVRWIQNGAAND